MKFKFTVQQIEPGKPPKYISKTINLEQIDLNNIKATIIETFPDKYCLPSSLIRNINNLPWTNLRKLQLTDLFYHSRTDILESSYLRKYGFDSKELQDMREYEIL